jgi:polyhydroxyalkanoate synthesis regulator protein
MTDKSKWNPPKLEKSLGFRWKPSNSSRESTIVTSNFTNKNPTNTNPTIMTPNPMYKESINYINPLTNNNYQNITTQSMPTIVEPIPTIVKPIPNKNIFREVQKYHSNPHLFINNKTKLLPSNIIENNINWIKYPVNKKKIVYNIFWTKFKQILNNPTSGHNYLNYLVYLYNTLRNMSSNIEHIRVVDNMLINMILILFYEGKIDINTILSNDVVKNVLKFYMDNIKALFPSFIKNLHLNNQGGKRSSWRFFTK